MGFANTAHGAALAKSKASKDIRRDALVSKGIEEDYDSGVTIVLSVGKVSHDNLKGCFPDISTTKIPFCANKEVKEA
jgi:hypothetical protein